MNEEIELLLRRFEEEFSKNHDYRIEDLVAAESINERSRKDQNFFYKYVIGLETSERDRVGQVFNKTEYESRFPEWLRYVDEAFEWLDKNQINKESLDLIEVTLQYDGGLVVHQRGRSDLPTELGKYTEITQIAKGGFGVVCRAYDTEAQEYRALKFPTKTFSRDSSFLDDVRKESQHSTDLHHPNIVKTYGMEVVEPFAFVVQEFVEGTSLREWMDSEHSFKEKAEMVAKIAAGLNFAHEQNITHLDIKPDNILVDSNNNPKITDFGLAFHERDRLGLPSFIVGTVRYLSPEVAEGRLRQSDGRADIFSLGVILYKMLTSHMPFNGSNNEEIIDQILTREPRPLRLANSAVPDELERICIRCLQKKILERYQYASDVEKELRLWEVLEEEPVDDETPFPPPPKFVPKGIKSYDESDKDFFLDLLPGVRDQGNIPASITFWMNKICEPVNEVSRIPNGFIFGPSGSGKSSFVKAGLLPQINQRIAAGNSNPVDDIYVESTREDTEVRLLNALRKRYPEIPTDESLPEVFAGLANGRWQSSSHSPQKILIVIDQFEQWISRGEEFETTQLVHALKHCNGESLQCLMLVRDDFVYACNRFADSLDINLEEGKNYQNIDPFDKKHARKILIKHCHAYDESFPDNEESLNREQKDFLKEAIRQLAEDNRIVCVRLTLFAQMFKDRDWTAKELTSAGGVSGIGEQFLESHFGTDGKSFHRIYRNRVQAIFEELLPGAGTKIRGSMKSREELIAAANCQHDVAEFDRIIHLLESELRLISGTEPDSPESSVASDNNSSSQTVYFQLTHDYVIEFTRRWILQTTKRSIAGRARLSLRDSCNIWFTNQSKTRLPSFFSYLSFLVFVDKRMLDKNESLMMKSAGRMFAFRLFSFSVLVTLLAFLYGRFQYQGKVLDVRNRIKVALSSNASEFERQVEDILRFKETAENQLKSFTGKNDSEKLRLDLLKAHILNDYSPEQLLNQISTAKGDESQNFVAALEKYRFALKQYISENEIEPKSRKTLRIAITAFYLGDANPILSLVSKNQNADFATALRLEIRGWESSIITAVQTFEGIDHSQPANDLRFIFCNVIAQKTDVTLSSTERDILSRWLMGLQKSTEDVGLYFAAVHTQSALKLGKPSGNTKVESINNVKNIRFGTEEIRMARIRGGLLKYGQGIGKFDLKKYGGKEEAEVKPFFISSREVAATLFFRFVDSNECAESIKARIEMTSLRQLLHHDNLPIHSISRDEAVQFCNWLSRECGYIESYFKQGKEWLVNESSNGFRLPTVDEWEVACRGKSKSTYFFGPETLDELLQEYGWCTSVPNPQLGIGARGVKLPNRFGLHDMIGNAAEWMDDYFVDYQDPERAWFAVRGGFAYDSLRPFKCAEYLQSRPERASQKTGIRLVLPIDSF